MQQVSYRHQGFILIIYLLPVFYKRFWHEYTYRHLDKPEPMVGPANLAGNFHCFIQVQVDLFLVWLCSEAEPGRKSVKLDVFGNTL